MKKQVRNKIKNLWKKCQTKCNMQKLNIDDENLKKCWAHKKFYNKRVKKKKN